MARLLHYAAVMRTLAICIALLTCSAWSAQAQETEPPDGTRIATARVSGFELSDLSPGLQADLRELVGTPLNRRSVNELATRLEAEQPRYLAAVRIVPDPEGDARVIFLMARIASRDRDTNVNARYVVEEVDVRGVPERDLSEQILADIQALAGQPLDSDAAARLGEGLRAAFPNHSVRRRLSRGFRSRQTRLIYDLRLAESARWLRFDPMALDAVFHSDQGWGAFLPLSIGGRNLRVSPVLALDHANDLIEEYSGFGIRVESRRLGTDRLGASFEWSTYDLDWRAPTVTTLALNPNPLGLYRNRSTVTTRVKFAVTRRLSVSGGASVTELDPLDEDPLTDEPLLGVMPSKVSNAFVASVNFDQDWNTESGRDHDLDAVFSLRAASEALESDFSYERYAGLANYRFRWDDHGVYVSALAGGIGGDAPLFERFALGDSRTLRGWDKYDIAPTGGDRMFHLSAEYRYRGLSLFLDSGSVWDTGTDRRVRVSTGVGFHPGPVFFTVGVPLNTDEMRAVFAMGFHVKGWDARVR